MPTSIASVPVDSVACAGRAPDPRADPYRSRQSPTPLRATGSTRVHRTPIRSMASSSLQARRSRDSVDAEARQATGSIGPPVVAVGAWIIGPAGESGCPSGGGSINRRVDRRVQAWSSGRWRSSVCAVRRPLDETLVRDPLRHVSPPEGSDSGATGCVRSGSGRRARVGSGSTEGLGAPRTAGGPRCGRAAGRRYAASHALEPHGHVSLRIRPRAGRSQQHP